MIIAISRLHKELRERMRPSGSVVVMLTFALGFTQPIIRRAFSLLFFRSPSTICLLESLQFVFLNLFNAVQLTFLAFLLRDLAISLKFWLI
jgi:hypothetical protein